MAALEGANALAHDKLVTLSEQNIIDCSSECSSWKFSPFPVKNCRHEDELSFLAQQINMHDGLQ